ncbi:methylamine utilization protein [Ideonella azotifigens]|nr:methylamine utilization protein [Ideonella azotifigens]MCD2339881.1 methylamine utilization protein [Ideonella azotifigens]
MGMVLWPVLAAAGPVTVQVSGAKGQPLADAVLMLEPVGAKAAVKPAAHAEVGQEGRQFVPLVSVVTVGTPVNFPNRDRVQHHVYSFSPAKKFEIKLYHGKPSEPIVFDQPGIVVLGCNIHDTMVGWVLVVDTPWHGKTAASGQLALGEVPAGSYRLRAWHPDLAPGAPLPEQAVTVGAGPEALTVRLDAGLK